MRRLPGRHYTAYGDWQGTVRRNLSDIYSQHFVVTVKSVERVLVCSARGSAVEPEVQFDIASLSSEFFYGNIGICSLLVLLNYYVALDS